MPAIPKHKPNVSKNIIYYFQGSDFFQVIEKFIRFAYRQRYNGQNMTYEASTFLYAIAVAVFALGGMCGGFVGGWVANKLGRFDFYFILLILKE